MCWLVSEHPQMGGAVVFLLLWLFAVHTYTAALFLSSAGVGKGIPGQLRGGLLSCREQPYTQSEYCRELGDYRNEWVDVNTTHTLKYR